MMASRRLLSRLVLLATVLVPVRALASASPMPSPPVPLPGVRIYGAAELTDVRVEVACSGTNALDASARCHVTAHARIRAVEPVELELPAGARVTIDGLDATGRPTLEPGRTAEVGLELDRDLTCSSRDRDSPWIFTGNRTRHLVFGESTSSERSGDGADGVLFEGVTTTIVGSIDVDARSAGSVRVIVGGNEVDGSSSVTAESTSIAIGVEGGAAVDPILQLGGPFLAAGVTGRFDEADAAFAMRAGYELALVDHLIVGIAFETDFSSIAESVVLEIASPQLVIILPSLSAGVGAVFRQLGQRDADGALRLRLGYQIFALGAVVDFDYWPAIGDWTITAMGRVSF